MMRFLIGLAAATYTATQIHPLLWFFLFLGGVLVAATLFAFWPLFLVLVIVFGGWWLAAQVLRWDKRRKRRQANDAWLYDNGMEPLVRRKRRP